MSTKGNLITKIAGDLSRSDLTTVIGEAIDKAIAFIQSERFITDVSRGSTFSTVIGQYIYTDTDLPGPPALSQFYEFDAVWIEDGGQRYKLGQVDYAEIEFYTDNAQSAGRPYEFARYKDQLWVYPVPDVATYTVRIAGHHDVAGPASDGEVGNLWMTDAVMFEYLRFAAEEDVYANKVKNMDLALKSSKLKGDWLYKLRERTSKKIGTGKIESSEIG